MTKFKVTKFSVFYRKSSKNVTQLYNKKKYNDNCDIIKTLESHMEYTHN